MGYIAYAMYPTKFFLPCEDEAVELAIYWSKVTPTSVSFDFFKRYFDIIAFIDFSICASNYGFLISVHVPYTV